jgi:hypothetical protein
MPQLGIAHPAPFKSTGSEYMSQFMSGGGRILDPFAGSGKSPAWFTRDGLRRSNQENKYHAPALNAEAVAVNVAAFN